MSKRILKIILYMLLLNSLFLCIYFAFHSSSHEPNPNLPLRFHVTVNNRSSTQKPWPILPSYLRGEESWFRCFYSETLQSSVCEGRNLRMVPDRIVMSRGGEKLEDVMGRNEEVELPEFHEAAFEVAEDDVSSKRNRVVSRRLVDEEMLNEYIKEGGIDRHTMRDLVASIRVVGGTEGFVCEEWVEEPTLLVTRFEYANMFHTVTDWYSAFVSSRVAGLPNRPHVVFIDGHCTTQLEETWTALFSGIRYAKNFSKPVCFRHAVLSPLGYETALFKGLSEDIDCNGESAQSLWQNPDAKKTARL
ncbi:hypothetical protein Rs2_40503 [Raphanus sativus]|nr:hypothetical protein Rs2_40503 [Raphanus sativus]